MAIRIRASRLRKQVERIIAHQPIYLTRWVRSSGGGTSAYSYVYDSSWLVRRDPQGRNVWGTLPTSAGTVAEQTTVITVPYVEGQTPPGPQDQIILLDLAGNDLGTFQVVHRMGFQDDAGETWKYDLIVQEQQ